MRIAPSSLPPHHCSPATRDFQSSIPELKRSTKGVTKMQWRSLDEQVMWAQHGHTQCVHALHLGDTLSGATVKNWRLI